MKTSQLLKMSLAVLMAAAIASPSLAADKEATPGYNHKIPEAIMTPDTVKTRIGTLKFFDGIPTKKTAALVYDSETVFSKFSTGNTQ